MISRKATSLWHFSLKCVFKRKSEAFNLLWEKKVDQKGNCCILKESLPLKVFDIVSFLPQCKWRETKRVCTWERVHLFCGFLNENVSGSRCGQFLLNIIMVAGVLGQDITKVSWSPPWRQMKKNYMKLTITFKHPFCFLCHLNKNHSSKTP